MDRLQKKYQTTVIPTLKKSLGLKNTLAVPRVDRIIINVGITEDQHQDAALKNMADQLAAITGQRPKTTRAHKSIASFHLRAGDPIGLMITLRRTRMYHFLDKLVNVVLPRVKDFQGVSPTAFDGHGNYSIGLEEQIIFPEIEYDKIDKVRGFQINILTTAHDDATAKQLLTLLGMPFKKAN